MSGLDLCCTVCNTCGVARGTKGTRYPEDLEGWVKAAAEREGISFSAFVIRALERERARFTGRWRHKYTVIDAFPVADVISRDDLPRWVTEAFQQGLLRIDGDGLSVISREDAYRAEPDWWLARGVKGEIYAIQPDIFPETYEPAEE